MSRLRSTSPRAAALDALLDSVTRRRVVDRLGLAALEVSDNPLQTLPSSIHIQQGLGFVKDPIIFGGLPHSGSLPTARKTIRDAERRASAKLEDGLRQFSSWSPSSPGGDQAVLGYQAEKGAAGVRLMDRAMESAGGHESGALAAVSPGAGGVVPRIRLFGRLGAQVTVVSAPDLDGWAVVERLLKDLAPLAEPVWLVVDDVHLLGPDQALRQLELLMMRAPDALRFVLCTRA